MAAIIMVKRDNLTVSETQIPIRCGRSLHNTLFESLKIPIVASNQLHTPSTENMIHLGGMTSGCVKKQSSDPVVDDAGMVCAVWYPP